VRPDVSDSPPSPPPFRRHVHLLCPPVPPPCRNAHVELRRRSLACASVNPRHRNSAQGLSLESVMHFRIGLDPHCLNRPPCSKDSSSVSSDKQQPWQFHHLIPLCLLACCGRWRHHHLASQSRNSSRCRCARQIFKTTCMHACMHIIIMQRYIYHWHAQVNINTNCLICKRRSRTLPHLQVRLQLRNVKWIDSTVY